MATVSAERISDGQGGLVPSSNFTHLAAGTMVSRDLQAARVLYENMLGLEVASNGSDRLLLRDRRAKYLMEHGERDFFVIEVRLVDAIERPQKMLNHWGISVGSKAEVDRLHQIAKAEKEKWWIKAVRPITTLHESYGFYFIDLDNNWWEIEHRGTQTNDGVFSNGDFDNRTSDAAMRAEQSLDISLTSNALVGSEAFLTHGTVDVFDVVNARNFYQDVLGLRSVLRFENAQFTAGGGDFAFVGVQVGSHVADQSPDNRWVLLVDDETTLMARHDNAIALREKFGIREVTKPLPDDEGYVSFLVESADSNWFEFSTRPREHYSSKFG